jgi:Fe-S cluster assembly iron-binding protein IscA
MLTVTDEAIVFLKTAKLAEGAPPDAGIRICRGKSSHSGAVAVGIAISEEPIPGDGLLERDGLRIFVEDALIEPLDGRFLDVRVADKGPELVLR